MPQLKIFCIFQWPVRRYRDLSVSVDVWRDGTMRGGGRHDSERLQWRGKQAISCSSNSLRQQRHKNPNSKVYQHASYDWTYVDTWMWNVMALICRNHCFSERAFQKFSKPAVHIVLAIWCVWDIIKSVTCSPGLNGCVAWTWSCSLKGKAQHFGKCAYWFLHSHACMLG